MNKQTILLVSLFLILFLLGFRNCHADVAPEFHFEAGSTYIRGLTPSIAGRIAYPGRGPVGSDYEFGVAINFPSGTNQANAAVEGLVVSHLYRMDMGIGIVLLQNTDQYNGSTVDFSLLLRYNINRLWYLQVAHWSNAGTAFPNYGRDMVRIGYRFR